MRVAASNTFRRMPWKNGKGETAEIAIAPAGAGISDFLWRISMATVAEDGPFSLFPGTDRTLAVLDGAGIRLAIDGAEEFALTAQDSPISFPADVATTARLIGGPIHDLNVMTRRDSFRHAMRLVRAPERIDAASAVTVVLALTPLVVTGTEGTADLTRLDAVFAVPGETLNLTDGPGAAALVITIDAL